MTLNDFLLKTNVDVKDNKNQLGNHLDAELARKGLNIDYNKNIEDVSEDELLEIGRILILTENKGKPFWSNELLDMMKDIIKKHQE